VANYIGNSMLYKWNTTISQFQSYGAPLVTHNNLGFEFIDFQYGKFLLVANNDTTGSSKYFTWNGTYFLDLNNNVTGITSVNHWKFFSSATDYYLIGSGNVCKIFNWDITSSTFLPYTTLSISLLTTPVHTEVFEVSGQSYFSICNGDYNSLASVQIFLYNSTNKDFAHVTGMFLATEVPVQSKAFQMGDDLLLAVALYIDSSASDTDLDSPIYIWESNSSVFEPYQPIRSHGGMYWDYFTYNGGPMLALYNGYNTALNSNSIDSAIYQFLGSTFAKLGALPTVGAGSIVAYVIEEDTYLLASSSGSSTSVLYKVV